MTSPIRLCLAAAPLVAGAMLSAASSTAVAQSLDETEMMRFLVQATCTDASGRQTGASPAEAACVNRSAQTPASPAGYRKHDWPAAVDAAAAPLGYQATDAVLSGPPQGQGDAVVVTQTFDFGGTGGGFQTFNPASGDGGQVIAITQGSASVFMTEDGGGGLQWFVGDGCQTGARPSELSWLLFRDDVVAGSWRADVARLSITRSQAECPAAFSSAYTRYIRARIAMPFLAAGRPAGSRTVDAIVSEHYDMPSIEQAGHLERFFLGRDLGLLRWERWENAATNPQAYAASAQLAGSGRCPGIALSDPPAQGWVMADCRMWTNIAPVGQWSVGQFGWSGLSARVSPTVRYGYGGGYERDYGGDRRRGF